MTSDEFLTFAKQYVIRPTVDINDDLAKGVEELFDQVHQHDPSIHYIPPTDRHVLNERFNAIYLGETLSYAITQIENECSVAFAITDREDDGIDVTLEYYPRIFSFEEVIRYRRSHPE